MTVARLEVEGASDILKLWEWQELNGTDSWISLGRGEPTPAVATAAGQGMDKIGKDIPSSSSRDQLSLSR